MVPVDKNLALIQLSESTRTDFGKVDFADQSEPQKVFSAIWELESQVNNGGFSQYFSNSDSDHIAHAPVALRAIGALRACAIVERALAFLGPLPATAEDRQDALDALPEETTEALEALDEEFIGYPDDLTELLFEFVVERPKTFGPIS